MTEQNHFSDNFSLRASHSFPSKQLWKEHRPWNQIHVYLNPAQPAGSQSDLNSKNLHCLICEAWHLETDSLGLYPGLVTASCGQVTS